MGHGGGLGSAGRAESDPWDGLANGPIGEPRPGRRPRPAADRSTTSVPSEAAPWDVAGWEAGSSGTGRSRSRPGPARSDRIAGRRRRRGCRRRVPGRSRRRRTPRPPRPRALSRHRRMGRPAAPGEAAHLGGPAYSAENDYPVAPGGGVRTVARGLGRARRAQRDRHEWWGEAGAPLAPGEQARAAEPVARLPRPPRPGRGVMMRGLVLLARCCLASPPSSCSPCQPSPRPARRRVAAGQAAAVTSVTSRARLRRRAKGRRTSP